MDRGLGGFGIFDQADDPSEGGVAPGTLGADVQGAGLQDRAGEHGRAQSLVFRGRFAGDRGLIDRAVAADDYTIDGQLFAGAGQDDVTGADRVDVNDTFAVCVAESGRLRHGADQPFDRRSRPFGVEIGDEFGEQDDRHQHRSGDCFTADHGEDRRECHEDLGTDLVLTDEVGQAGLGQRIQPDRDRRPQHPEGHPVPGVGEHEHPDDHDSGDLDPSATIHHRPETNLRWSTFATLRRRLADVGGDRVGGHPAAFAVVVAGWWPTPVT